MWKTQITKTYSRMLRGVLFPLLGMASLMALASSPVSGQTADLPLSDNPASNNIRYVVVIFQENRTPDNLFHGLRGADIANTGKNSKGKTIVLKPRPLADIYNPSHEHISFVQQYDHGKMDGVDKNLVYCPDHQRNCPPPHPQFKYVYRSDVEPYFQLAEQYTFADRMFQTNQGPSFSAHQYIISGTSAPSVGSDLLVADGPHFDRGKDQDAGCTAPLEEYVWLIDPSGDESQTMYPCFEHPTLMDLLDGKGISWRHYSPGSGSFWNGPNAIYHVRFGPDWKKNDVWPPTKVLDDIAAGTLAQVTWVIPAGRYSDHSSSTDGSGPSWVASIVNAIGKSPYWAHTAIFITWDDWGGWYDHVAPKIVGSYEYGFRVPMIVVSPYAKSGYVSHVTHDFGSILHFTEAVFGLPSLGYADARADDLSDCFNFHQAPLPFQTISAPYSAEYFLNDRRPLTNPDDY